jgi:hypothetical protein
MTNPAFGLDFILSGPLPKAVLDGVATPEQAAQYEIVELPEIENFNAATTGKTELDNPPFIIGHAMWQEPT